MLATIALGGGAVVALLAGVIAARPAVSWIARRVTAAAPAELIFGPPCVPIRAERIRTCAATPEVVLPLAPFAGGIDVLCALSVYHCVVTQAYSRTER